MENEEAKKIHWKSIKGKFLELIPKDFKIQVDGISDDSKYYHPKIIINNEVFIRSQCDLETNYVYGISICIDDINSHMFSLHLEVEQLAFVLSNWEKVSSRIIQSLGMTKSLFDMRELLNNTMNNIMSNAVSEIEDKHKIKQIKDDIFKITEFIDNNRLDK